jgi:hypothetical protein
MEAKVGKGYLMISNIDLFKVKENSAAGKQLYYSLMRYLDSDKTQNAMSLDPALLDRLLQKTPALDNQSGAPDTSRAVLDIYPAENAVIGKEELWSKESNRDRIGQRKEGFDYWVEGSFFKDYLQSIWMAKHIKIGISCPEDFKGSFYVYLLDQYDEGKAAAMFFAGRDRGPVPRYDRKGVWLKFEITPEMVRSGEIVFDARATEGPNVSVHRLVVIPED